MKGNGSIDREEALRFLELSDDADPESLQDAYEKICFQVRQKALMMHSVPRVMKKRFEVLTRAKEAYEALGGDREGELGSPSSFSALSSIEEATRLLGSPPPWSTLLRSYEERVGRAKLEVANSFTALPLSQGILRLIEYQKAFHTLLYSGFGPIVRDPEAHPRSSALIDKEIKASQGAYTGTLIKDLEELEKGGFGKEGMEGSYQEIEGWLQKGKGEEERIGRILTEVQRVHQLVRLDQRAG